jgi:hypothetical protein
MVADRLTAAFNASVYIRWQRNQSIVFQKIGWVSFPQDSTFSGS